MRKIKLTYRYYYNTRGKVELKIKSINEDKKDFSDQRNTPTR